MDDSFEATADMSLNGGLVCITVKACGAPETVLRMPRSLAIEIARRINKVSTSAPNSWPSTPPRDERKE